MRSNGWRMMGTKTSSLLCPLLCVLGVTALMTHATSARADAADAVELVTIAWEAYWNQSGFPKSVMKWQGPIRVKFTGDEADRHKDFSLQQLKTVAQVAGIEV